MSQSAELQIEDCENQLKQAMLLSDVSALDVLLAPDLVFTNHLGQLMTKQNDLDAHKSGRLKITKIILSEAKIKIHNGVAVVSVQAYIAGSFAGKSSESDFRLRVFGVKHQTKPGRLLPGTPV